ncbi:MAG: PLP-dependent aminotransferase family protein [Lachnospiraceae bacterium]|nr:PLP-dependent aminotransferase family protein [Lachnospiraceae bacterium]
MADLTIQLTDGAEKCLYQQIYEHIRDEIRKGKLLAGEKLPSTRSLAEYLQVARSTVDFAYSQLVAEGYVEARPCRGYFVNQAEDMFHLQPEDLSEALPAPADMQTALPEMSSEILTGEDLDFSYDFSPHAISLKDFPFATWKKITKNILVDANSEMFALGDAQGDMQLRETIGRYLHASRGVNCRPEQIIIGAGTDYLLMLLEKILGRHVPVAMEEPTYKRAYRVFQSFAYEIEAIPMDENGMDVEKLRQTKARAVYVMPSHQYPTGVVMPIGRRLELLKWAKEEKGRYLIEDDYDSEFRYRGKPIPALQASDREGRVIYMGTFSKSIAPAIRVGYMVLPLSLLKVYRENCGFYACTVSRIDQRILNEFIKDGYFERYLNKMRKIYKVRHDFLLNQLGCFEKAFDISGENAGLHILLTSRKHIPEKTLTDAAAREGVKLYGISKDCMRKENAEGLSYEGTVLLGYGALEEQELEKGIQLLKKAWNPYL